MRDDYTAALLQYEPITFEQFALLCARSDPHLLTTLYEGFEQIPLPPRIDPNDEYLFQLRQAEARLAEVDAWDDATAEAEASHAYERARLHFELRLSVLHGELDRLKAAYSAVQAWQPPAKDFRWLKGFMLDQLRNALEDRAEPLKPPMQRPGADYRAERRAALERAAEQNRRLHEADVMNAESASEWLGLLRANLGMLG